MIYSSLQLSAGGGYNGEESMNDGCAVAGFLAIGLGGIGIAALADVKSKISKQITPAEFPKMQFLAIDSDLTELLSYQETDRLETHEILRIFDQPFDAVLQDPRFDWFDLQRMHIPPFLNHAHGNRQLGRYFLFRNIDQVILKLSGKLLDAAYGHNLVNVHVFTGTTGGTGSGCFVDICYLLRKLASDHGLDVRIFGYGFLPGILEERFRMNPGHPTFLANSSRGYAALKELDYLMHMEGTQHRYTQKYTDGFLIDTQQPPMDLCYLISARGPHCEVFEDTYTNALNSVSEFVLSFLREDIVIGNVNAGATMGAVLNQPMPPGAAASRFAALGAAVARVPVKEFYAYLADALLRQINDTAKNSDVKIDRELVHRLCDELGMNTKSLFFQLQTGAPSLILPDIDPRELRDYGPLGRGRLPECWASVGNDWVEQCRNMAVACGSRLGSPVQFDNPYTGDSESLATGLFQRLSQMFADKRFGPVYVNKLFRSDGYSLIEFVEKNLAILDQRINEALSYRNHSLDILCECSERFLTANFLNRRRLYEEYKSEVERYLELLRQLEVMKVLHDFYIRLRHEICTMATQFFIPLGDVLSNLMETSSDNVNFLNQVGPPRHEIHLISCDQVRMLANQMVAQLDPETVAHEFMEIMRNNREAWIQHHPRRIERLFFDFVRQVCPCNEVRSILDYWVTTGFRDVDTFHAEEELYNFLICHVLPHLKQMAEPRGLACETLMRDTAVYRDLSVPQAVHAAAVAADTFSHNNPPLSVRYVRDNTRLSVVTSCKGLAVNRFEELRYWKHCYLQQCYHGGIISEGVRLYSNTGRQRGLALQLNDDVYMSE